VTVEVALGSEAAGRLWKVSVVGAPSMPHHADLPVISRDRRLYSKYSGIIRRCPG
jgi:hypothetical protein